MNLCFDIGGMSLKYCFIKDEELLNKNSVKFDGIAHVDFVFQQISKIIEENLDKNIKSICISSPGVVNSKTGEISGLSAIKDLNKINFKVKLSEKFKIPVFIDNDSNCATLAELKLGNARGFENAAVIVIGTGIGGTLIINQKIYKGSFLSAGEFGCILNNLQGDRYINWSEASSMKFLEKEYFNLAKLKKSGQEIYDLYEDDENAKKAINLQMERLSTLILTIGFMIDPNIVLIGGAISQNGLFIKLINDCVKDLYNKSGMKINLKIDKCKFLNDSNLIGANELAKI